MIIAVSGIVIERRFLGLLTRKGSAGAGKGLISDRLVKEHRFVPIAFADPMKRFLRETYQFSVNQLWGPSETRGIEDSRYPRRGGYLTPRYCLQQLGEEFGRHCYKNTWVDYGLRIAKDLQAGYGIYDPQEGFIEKMAPRRNVVFTDLRHENEFWAIKEAGGKVIRCVRPGVNLSTTSKHQSEKDLLGIHDSQFDAVIHNISTVEDLWKLTDVTYKTWAK